MLTINDPQHIAPSGIPHLALAVRQNPPPPYQNHVGLYYRTPENSVRLLHSLFHYVLRNDPPDDSFYWIPCKLNETLAATLALYIETVWQRNRAGLPYSFEYVPEYFDFDGNPVQSAPGTGVTCATMIMAILAVYGLELVDRSTWPKQPTRGDVSFQKRLAAAVDKTDSTQGQALKAFVGKSVRFQPEQIAGAFGVFVGDPLSYKDAEGLATQVVKVISAPYTA